VNATIAAASCIAAGWKAAAARGWLEERPCVMEVLTAFKRAGADGVLTYFALDVAGWLNAGG